MAVKELSDQKTGPKARSHPISIEHVAKSYGGDVVVDDLSFTVTPGRVTGVLGPNGAGKSTTMKILLGLASPTSGQATIGGLAYGGLADPTGTVGASVELDAFHLGEAGETISGFWRTPRTRHWNGSTRSSNWWNSVPQQTGMLVPTRSA